MLPVHLSDLAALRGPVPDPASRPSALVVATWPPTSPVPSSPVPGSDEGDDPAASPGPRHATLVAPDDLPGPLAAQLEAALAALRATGKAEEVVLIPLTAPDRPADVVAAIGLGEPSDDGRQGPSWQPDTLRRAAGAAGRALVGHTDAVVALSGAERREGHVPAAVAAVVEGFTLGAHRSDRRPTSAGSPDTPSTEAPSTDAPSPGIPPSGTPSSDGASPQPVAQLTVAVADPSDTEVAAALSAAVVTAAAVAQTRDWVNTPPNLLVPDTLARDVAVRARGLGVEVSVLDEVGLREAGFGGITAVGQGSANPPRLVRLTWRPPGTEGAALPRIALVGKGITFDSGGLSLKPPPAMTTMKADMSGAAAVAAATLALADLGVAAEVTAWLAIAENMPSGTAQRPGDVITMYGGRTVEVLNTDAEGRLVLADALVRACEEGPDVAIVVATLTGAQGIALGTRTCGVMGDPDVRGEVVAVADAVGEAMWPMPMPEDVRRAMDTDVADIANIGDSMGGMLAGALFLREFVPEGMPWAHIDIARPAFNEKSPWGHVAKGGTGVAVRTLIAYVTARAAAGRPRAD